MLPHWQRQADVDEMLRLQTEMAQKQEAVVSTQMQRRVKPFEREPRRANKHLVMAQQKWTLSNEKLVRTRWMESSKRTMTATNESLERKFLGAETQLHSELSVQDGGTVLNGKEMSSASMTWCCMQEMKMNKFAGFPSSRATSYLPFFFQL